MKSIYLYIFTDKWPLKAIALKNKANIISELTNITPP